VLTARLTAPALFLLVAARAAASAQVDFERDVKPILVASCLGCHGPTLAEGSLRVDSRESLLAGGASGPALVPGAGRESLLHQRLVADDPEIRMRWAADPLAPQQIEILRLWIDEGASWPRERTSFNRDVRPILAGCYACHGPDRNQRQAGLRLDREDAAKSRLPSGRFAVVPYEPEKSALIERVTHPEESVRMPLASSGKPRLSASEIATLRDWISEGAPWESHWSFVPPERPPIPTTARSDWAKNEVDAFVLAAIEKNGASPSPEAKRFELLRRLSFDLTGLPPTPEEIRAFEEDGSSEAYENEVDRLLASPAYGERMATFWLDLVRYADSAGYHSDNARNVWRYRDWVVSALNRNLPFDRFTIEQLAGDLLPDAGLEEKIASGYNRLLQTTEEGGAQPKEYRAIYLADRVRNASTVWLGTTLGCAQCHDHKFDPFLAKDFYSFAAFFADVREPPVGRRHPDALPSEQQRPRFEAIEAEIERLQEELEAPREAQREWEESIRGKNVCWTTLEPVAVSSAMGTRVLIQGNDFSLIATTSNGPKPPRDTYTVRFVTTLQGITAFRLDALPFEELPKGGPGRSPDGGFVVSELVLIDESGDRIALENPLSSTPASRGVFGLDAADGEGHQLLLDAATPVGVGAETTLTLVLHQNEGDLETLGRFRFSGTTASCRELGPALTEGIVRIAETPIDERTPEQELEIASFYRRLAAELGPLRAKLFAAGLVREELLEDVPQSLVTIAEEPEPVRILPRGNWLDESGPVVEPAVPHFLPPIENGGRRATRLDLARWLVSSENPLTARVLVNRLWKLAFGRGIVTTLEDFGTQGEWPTHPELLDWLAVELVESGWDVKHVMRTIVTSAAYRQSSRGSPEILEHDPENRLFARQGRFRLDAEMVRDNALAVSGLLSREMGGPSVFPHQPPGYWTFLNFPPREWEDSPGEDRYRRGLYTWWQRTFLHPSLLAFDAPTREECVAERTRSNIPQQALVLLNDPTYVEAARAFAGRIVREGGTTFEDRTRFAFTVALGREPGGEEGRIVQDLYQKQSGDETARWTPLARVLLNLPELVTRP
jgi:cytochrome c553